VDIVDGRELGADLMGEALGQRVWDLAEDVVGCGDGWERISYND